MVLGVGQLARADYFVLISYFALNLLIGVYFYRRMRGMKDFFSGGERIPWWLSGISFYMSCFSVFAFVVYSGLGYRYGWLPVTIFWAYIPATLLSALVFAPRWRRARVHSPVEYLETRFNPALRQLTALQGVPVKIIDDGLKLVATGYFVSKALGLDLEQCVFWSGMVILAYTFLGGLWAVMVTDFLQFVVMIAGVVVLCPLAISRAGGLQAFIHNSPEGFFYPVADNFGWVYIITLAVMNCLTFASVHWQLIQRFTSVRDERETLRVGLCVTALHLVTPILIFTPAMAARFFLPATTEAEAVYPTLCTTLLPAGLLGLIIAAMLAATMSMLSGDYNVCANVLTNDVYKRLWRPQASQRELVAAGRLTTLLVGLLALGIAFLVLWRKEQGGGQDTLFRSMVQLFSVATAPVAVPMIAGLLSRRVTPTAALVGFIAGLSAGLALFFMFPGTMVVFGVVLQKENGILFSTMAVTLAFTVLVSWVDVLLPDERLRIQAFMERLATPIGRLPEDHKPPAPAGARRAFSPMAVSGFMVVLVGLLMLAILPAISESYARWLDLGVAIALVAVGAGMIILGRRRLPSD